MPRFPFPPPLRVRFLLDPLRLLVLAILIIDKYIRMARQTRNRSGSGKRSTRRRRQRSRKQRGGADISREDNLLLLKFIKLYLADIPDELITGNKPVKEVLEMLCFHKDTTDCVRIQLYELDDENMLSLGDRSVIGVPRDLLWKYTKEPRQGFLRTVIAVIKKTFDHLVKYDGVHIVNEGNMPVFQDGYPLLINEENYEHIAKGGPDVKYALYDLLNKKMHAEQNRQ